MCLVIQSAGYPLHIMVVCEVVQPESQRISAAHVIQPFHCMGYLEIIMLVMAGIKCLM